MEAQMIFFLIWAVVVAVMLVGSKLAIQSWFPLNTGHWKRIILYKWLFNHISGYGAVMVAFVVYRNTTISTLRQRKSKCWILKDSNFNNYPQ